MTEINQDAGNASSSSGSLCLDFANTVEWHASNHPSEHLNCYADLIAWSRRAGIVSDHIADRLQQMATRRPADAKFVYQQAIVLRETVYRIFTSISSGRAPQADDLAALNLQVPDVLAKLQIVAATDGFTWGWKQGGDALDQVLWPIIRSAAELLVSGVRDRIRQCADDVDGCGWLFIDTTKNHSRRWCDMRDCGNRAKARRFHARKRQAAVA